MGIMVFFMMLVVGLDIGERVVLGCWVCGLYLGCWWCVLVEGGLRVLVVLVVILVFVRGWFGVRMWWSFCLGLVVFLYKSIFNCYSDNSNSLVSVILGESSGYWLVGLGFGEFEGRRVWGLSCGEFVLSVGVFGGIVWVGSFW